MRLPAFDDKNAEGRDKKRGHNIIHAFLRPWVSVYVHGSTNLKTFCRLALVMETPVGPTERRRPPSLSRASNTHPIVTHIRRRPLLQNQGALGERLWPLHRGTTPAMLSSSCPARAN